MNRPSFQFYPKDWRGNANLRRCSFAERGIWMDVMCLMHDSNEYGVLRWPLKEIASAVGCSVRDLQSIANKDVLRGSDTRLEVPYVFIPRSGRKDGTPITLVPAQDGPIWFSTRMVRDEYVRQSAGAATRFASTKPAAGLALTSSPSHRDGERLGEEQSDGSSSSTAVKLKEKLPTTSGADAPDPIFGYGLAFLMRKGVKERPGRGFLGALRKQLNDDLTVAELLAVAEREDVSDPLAWLSAAAKTRKVNGSHAARSPYAQADRVRTLARDEVD